MSRALAKPAPSPLVTLAADIEGAVRAAGEALADNTIAAYKTAWRSFAVWCREVGKTSLAAEPETVAVYMEHVATHRKYKPATIELHLAAIAWAHGRHRMTFNRRDPAVADVRAGLRRRLGVSQKRARPLLVEDLERLVAPLGDAPIDLRDKALLLLSFAGAFRSSELLGDLSGLRVSDCRRTRHGYELRVRRSKTDQEGEGVIKYVADGRPATCPVAALDAWLAWPGHKTDGPLFVGFPRGLPDPGVALRRIDLQRILLRRAARAGVDATGYSGHSPRAGLVTEAVEAGVPTRDIQQVTGHKDINMIEVYVRRNRAKVRPAAKGLL